MTLRLKSVGDAEDSDETLMLRYATGDAAAFDIVYARHKSHLLRYFLRQCRDRSQAEELFQDVWMNLIRTRARYEVRAKFTTYLYTLAHNRLMDFFRANRVVFVDIADLESVAFDSSPLPDERAAFHELATKLLRSLEMLPAAQREAFLLHAEAGLSMDQIAEVTGVPKEAAKSRLRYAVRKLREALSE